MMKTLKTIFSKTLLAFFVLIFIIPQTTNAQFSEMLNNMGTSGGGNGNLSGSLNVQGLGGVLLSCTGLDSKIKGMLGNLTNSFKNKGKDNKNPDEIGESGGTNKPADTEAPEAVPTTAPATVSAVTTVDSTEKEAATTLEEENKAQQCLKDIAYYGAKKLLEKFTTQTINWIQGGFKGQPMYLRDPQSFFKDLANEEWAKITNTIAFDTENYPFGRDTMIALLRSELSTFEKNAQFTLRQAVPTGDETDFYRDIRIGGLNAFFAQTLLPQNNPVGFYEMTQQVIDRKTEGGDINNIMSIKEELNQSGGFLSQKICAISEHESGEYIDPSKENDGIFNEQDWKDIRDDKNRTAEERDDAKKRICKIWETTTPGQTIANVLATTTTTNIRQAELIKDVNQSLAAIFDAALAKLAEMGLKALEGETDDTNGTTINGGGYGQNIVGGSLQDTLDGILNDPNDPNGDGSPTSLGNNLYENLPYLIFIQKKYAGIPDVDNPLPPAPQYENEDGVMVDLPGYEDPTPLYGGLRTNNDRLYDVVFSLQNLDVCIPGPHYGWEDELDTKFDEYLADKLSSGTFEVKDWAQQFSQMLDPSGQMSGQIDKWVAQGQKSVTLGYYEIYRQLKVVIKDRWPDDLLKSPTITPDANKELARLDTYIEQIDINKVRIDETKRLIVRLETLKEKIDEVTASINGVNAQIALLTHEQLNTPMHQELLDQLAVPQASLEKHKRTFYRMAGSLIGKADLLDARDDMDEYVDLREYSDELWADCTDQTSSNDPVYPHHKERKDTWSIYGTLIQGNAYCYAVGTSIDLSDFDFEDDWIAQIFTSGLTGYYPTMCELENALSLN